MMSKERVRTALARRTPDRLPAMVSFNTETQGGLFNLAGLSARDKIMRDLGTDDYENVLQRLGIDVRILSPRSVPVNFDAQTRYRRFQEDLQQAHTPLDLRRLDWPSWDLTFDFARKWDCTRLREDLQRLLDLGDYAIQLDGPSVWEVVRLWRGFDQALIDWLTNPQLTAAMFERTSQFFMPLYEAVADGLGDLRSEIDYIYAGSDFGMQDRLMVAPDLFVRDYEPIVRQEVGAFKQLFPNAFYEFHCCGSVIDILPSLIRAGVQVLHPVQPAARGMDFRNLKAAFGQKLAFRGGVDAQTVLARGSADDVRQAVLDAFHTLGEGGGFIISPHGIMPEVPTENVLALFDTVQNECWY